MQSLKRYQSNAIIFVLATFSTFLFLAQGENLDLHFSREIPSQLDANRLDRNISSVTRWPQWFYSLEKAEIVSSPTPDSPMIQNGSIIALHMDPHKGLHRQFTLTAEVTQYEPGKNLELKILKDSSGRLTKLFDSLSWNIKLSSQSTGSLIQGTALAHTCHWRSRLFGKLSNKILMNQLFYPDLFKLSELKQPFSMDLSPQLMPQASRSF